MKKFILGLVCGLLIVSACAMSKRSQRLVSPVDQSMIHWYMCTKEMTPDYQGKACLVECQDRLKADGSCTKDEYKYIVKDIKENHEFFSKFIIVPADQFF